jgi:hypothetical protein
VDSSNAAPLARDKPEQRRETMLQIEDLDLEVINPDAAGIAEIDIAILSFR